MVETQVLIIGAGPAGMSCALQLKRFGLSPVIIEQNMVGGLLLNANLVENYMGFAQGISGIELVAQMKAQLNNLNIEIKNEKAVLIEKKESFIVKTDKNSYKAAFLVFATGTTPKQLPLDNVFYNVYELLGEKGKTIVVIGSGDAAFDYALNLCKNNKVLILNRSENVKCIPLLKQRADKEPNIGYFPNTTLEDVAEHYDFVLGAIGREANLELIDDKIMKEENVFLIGDVKNGMRRQSAIAVGDGLRVAMDIYEKANDEGNF